MKLLRFSPLFAALGAFVAGIPVAAPAAVPAATGYVECPVSGGYIDDPSSCSTSSESATRVLSPDPTLTATAAYPGGFAVVTASASSFLTYYFAVVGGQFGDIVPVEVDFSLAARQTGDGYGSAYFSVTGFGSKEICTRSNCADQSETYTGAFHFNASVGLNNEVYTFAQAGASYGPDARTGYAMVDPYIFIDPTFANAGNYRIVVSDGVGNVAPTTGGVPEPATWGLMLAGFALAGVGLRRREIAAAAAAA